MRYLAITIIAAISFMSCNGDGAADNSNTDTTVTATEAPEQVTAIPEGSLDPVCDMVKDSTWTEYTVNGTDTVWFCSETCKTAYTANPAKYAAKG